MAKAHRYFIGAGCLLMVFGVVIFALIVRGLSKPSLPREMVLSLRLAGPISEVTADDPLAELMGEQATSLRKLREALVKSNISDIAYHRGDMWWKKEDGSTDMNKFESLSGPVQEVAMIANDDTKLRSELSVLMS